MTNEPVAMTEHEREANGVEQDATEASVHYAFYEHVYGFAAAAETGFKHREADLHPENQERGDESPCSIDRIDHVAGFDRRISGVCAGEEFAGADHHQEHHQSYAQSLAAQQYLPVLAPFRIAQPQS